MLDIQRRGKSIGIAFGRARYCRRSKWGELGMSRHHWTTKFFDRARRYFSARTISPALLQIEESRRQIPFARFVPFMFVDPARCSQSSSMGAVFFTRWCV